MEIRRYRAADREAVRAISHETGFMGEPADWFWRDRRSFADLATGYYTDLEPSSALVIDEAAPYASSGRLVGYLLGCVDSSRRSSITTTLLRHALGRALLLRPGTAGVLWRGLGDVAGELVSGRGVPSDAFSDDRYPSHFHLDLLPEARGCGLGSELVKAFLAQLADQGSPGCHIETIAENGGSVAFFRSRGFEPYGDPRPLPGWRTRAGGRMHVLVMTSSIGAPAA